MLKIKGNDAKAFLNRQASNDLQNMSKPVYTAFLKPNAEIVSLTCVLEKNNEIYIYCKNPDELKEHLEKFVIVEDVSFQLGDCFADARNDSELLAMTNELDHDAEPVQRNEVTSGLVMTNKSFIKFVEASPEKKLLEKYVSFTKGCFPGQEPLAKFKNIGMRKREERSGKLLDEALGLFAHAKAPKELDPAIELLRKALKENPRNEDAMESLGVMLAKQEKYQEAIMVMHQLEMLNPHNEMAQMNLSIFYMKIGDKESAEEHKAKGTVLQFDKALKA